MVPASIKFFFNQVNYRVWIHSETWTLHDNNMSQMHRTDKYSQQSSIIWPVWLNGWVSVYELSGCGSESSCSHLHFRFRTCFEQWVPWHSGNYRVLIHSETCTSYDKNIKFGFYFAFSNCHLHHPVLSNNCNNVFLRC